MARVWHGYPMDMLDSSRVPAPEFLAPAMPVTSFARPEGRQRALEAGYQRHFAKPFDPDAIVNAIDALVRPRNRDQGRDARRAGCMTPVGNRPQRHMYQFRRVSCGRTCGTTNRRMSLPRRTYSREPLATRLAESEVDWFFVQCAVFIDIIHRVDDVEWRLTGLTVGGRSNHGIHPPTHDRYLP
jgi:hypothetical protein